MLNNAAKKIQRQVRTFLARRHLIAMRRAVVTIQKYWRGMEPRLEVRKCSWLDLGTLMLFFGLSCCRFVLGEFLCFLHLCRESCSEAIYKIASRSCCDMYSKECSDVACSKEVSRNQGCCCQDTSWLSRNGCSQGVPVTQTDKSSHHHSGIEVVRRLLVYL